MKKLALTLGMACLFMVACNNAPKQKEAAETPEQTEAIAEKSECPMSALKAEYANWDNLDETAKAELNKKACDLFAQMEARKAEMMENGEPKPCCKEGEPKPECKEGEPKPCCKEMAEMTDEQKAEFEAKKAEMEAKCAEMKAAWENFDNLNLDEQKDLIMGRLEGCGEPKPCCKGEGKPCGEKPAE